MRFGLVTVTCLCLMAGGCSFLFVTGAPAGHDRLEYFDCTTSYGWPTFDAIYGTVNTAANIGMASKGGPSQSTYTGGAILSAILWGSSSAVGFGKVSGCRKAKGLEFGEEEDAPDEPAPQETRQCPAGMRLVDSVHCCGPGQRFVSDGAECRGAPTCPRGTVASGASCKALLPNQK